MQGSPTGVSSEGRRGDGGGSGIGHVLSVVSGYAGTRSGTFGGRTVFFGELGLELEAEESVVLAFVPPNDAVDDDLFEVVVEAELGLGEGVIEVSVFHEPSGDGLEGGAGSVGALAEDAAGGEFLEEDAFAGLGGELTLGKSGSWSGLCLVGHGSHLSSRRREVFCRVEPSGRPDSWAQLDLCVFSAGEASMGLPAQSHAPSREARAVTRSAG